MAILAFDPGTATTGYAVIERTAGEKLAALDFGVIRTSPDDSAHKRLQILYNEVDRLITTYNPESVATERLFFARNETTAIAVGRAIGVILLAIAQHDLPWSEYTPLQVKLGVTGTGTADKSQVQFMVTRLMGLEKAPKPDDAADALAVAICHIHSSKLAKIGVKKR